jgi:hypothetical protein
MGRGLCNFALDGDGQELSARDAFHEAQILLQEALDIRKRYVFSLVTCVFSLVSLTLNPKP